MFEFIDTHCEPDEIAEMLHVAGVRWQTFARWRDKKSSPTIYSCILISKAIAKKYDLQYDTLILQCIKYVVMFT